MQNYKPAIWLHCWSLGVEEHFYILLPILLLLLIRFSSNSSNPFRAIPRTFLVLAVVCFALRAATVHFTPPASYNGDTIAMPTHLRIDELFFGVLLGYLYSFHRERVDNFMRPTSNRLLIGLATIVLLSTSFIFPGTGRFYLVFGPTFLYLGFGGLLLLSLYVRGVLPPRFAGPLGKLGTAAAFVGLYSYSIYLSRSIRTLHDPRAQAVFSHSTRRVPVLRMVFLRVRGIRYRDGPAHRVSRVAAPRPHVSGAAAAACKAGPCVRISNKPGRVF